MQLLCRLQQTIVGKYKIFKCYYPRSEGGIVVGSVRLCIRMSVCLSYDNSWKVRDIIMEFSWHHTMVERANKFENGYIGVRG